MQAEKLDHAGGLLVSRHRINKRAGRMLLLACTVGMCAGATTASCGAAEGIVSPGVGPEPTPQGRIVSLGVFSLFGPKYLGAERVGPLAYPTFEVRRPNEPFALSSPDDGISVALLDTPNLKIGPTAGLRQGRNAGVDHRFTGLDHDPWAIEAGIFVDYWVLEDRLRARVEVRHGLRGQDGLAVDLSADVFQRVGQYTLSIGPRLGLLDAPLAQLQFGVSPEASARNGFFSPYSARGGLQTIGISTAITYDWSESWRTMLYGRYDRLVGDAAASTITQRLGATDQLTTGVGITYSFYTDLLVGR